MAEFGVGGRVSSPLSLPRRFRFEEQNGWVVLMGSSRFDEGGEGILIGSRESSALLVACRT